MIDLAHRRVIKGFALDQRHSGHEAVNEPSVWAVNAGLKDVN